MLRSPKSSYHDASMHCYQEYIYIKGERKSVILRITMCKHSLSSTCAVLHTVCIYLLTNVCLVNQYQYSHCDHKPECSYYYCNSYASTCTYGQFDLCTLRTVFAQGNTEQDTLSPFLHSCCYLLAFKISNHHKYYRIAFHAFQHDTI